MARKLNNLFQIVGRILSAIILYSTIAASQQSKSPDEFIIGAKLGNGVVNLQETFNSFVDCGFNSIWWKLTQIQNHS